MSILSAYGWDYSLHPNLMVLEMGNGGPQRKIGVMLPEYRGVDIERKRNALSLTFSVTEGAEWDWEGHWHSFKLCLGLGGLTAVVF